MSGFISVGALGHGFEADSNILAPTDVLAGRSIDLDVGPVQRWGFGEDGSALADGTPVQPRVTSIRDGIVLIDRLVEAGGTTEAHSTVVDLTTGHVTHVRGTLPDERQRTRSLYERARDGEPLTSVGAEFSHGRASGDGIGREGAAAGEPHAVTSDLVGMRNRYDYSPTEAYEHIYLTPELYSWHCLSGVEAGLADTDACHYLRIAEELYLFMWREKIVPTLGLLLIDLAGGRTDGKIFGNDGFDTTSFVNFPAGAQLTVLNRTEH